LAKISKNFAGSNPAPAANFQYENGLEKMLCLGIIFYGKYSSALGKNCVFLFLKNLDKNATIFTV